MSEQPDIAEEATEILGREVRRLRELPYGELQRYLEPDAFEVESPSGRTFQVEVTALWDDRKRSNLRIIVAIDDSRGWRFRDYRSNDFIIAPDGSFIGEA
jgi:hypothetical protein